MASVKSADKITIKTAKGKIFEIIISWESSINC